MNFFATGSYLNLKQFQFSTFRLFILFFFLLIPISNWSKSNGVMTVDGNYKYYNVGLQDQFTYLEINGQ
ncbi:hypothetical protein LEP1GSC041_4588, partial [Leptospira noguchii str. 2006001870]